MLSAWKELHINTDIFICGESLYGIIFISELRKYAMTCVSLSFSQSSNISGVSRSRRRFQFFAHAVCPNSARAALMPQATNAHAPKPEPKLIKRVRIEIRTSELENVKSP